VKLPYIPIIAALFFNSGAENKPADPAPVPATVEAAIPQPEVLPLGPIVDAHENKPEAEVIAPELPAGMRVVMNSKKGTKMLTLVHPGHLVTLRQGDTVALGDNAASIPMKEAAPMEWESSERQTFETVRGVLAWEPQAGKQETPKLRATARAVPMREISAERHRCKAFEESNEIVTVLCRVDSLAVGAVRAFGNTPQDGITMLETADRRYFRMALDTSKNEFDSVVLGYSDGIRGHVIRLEASKLPGETKTSFTMLAATRAQPFRIRRFRHHPPHDFPFF
jgi:hypothetical protein